MSAPDTNQKQSDRADQAVPDQRQRDNETIRLDKWLWYTRMVKTRSLASRLVASGKVRINRGKCDKPAQALRRGDVVTATIGKNVRVLEVVELGQRRGPAVEAQALYDDLAPLPDPKQRKEEEPSLGIAIAPQREPGAGRPTKRERRQIDRLRSTDN